MVTNGAAFICCFRGPCNRTARLGAESDDTSAGSWAAEGGEPASPENRCAVAIPRHGQREGAPCFSSSTGSETSQVFVSSKGMTFDSLGSRLYRFCCSFPNSFHRF